MTNLLAWITFEFVTNWTTISRTIPEPIRTAGGAIAAIYQPAMANQVGNVSSNVVLNFVFEGFTNRVTVKTTPLAELLQRSIVDPPMPTRGVLHLTNLTTVPFQSP